MQTMAGRQSALV